MKIPLNIQKEVLHKERGMRYTRNILLSIPLILSSMYAIGFEKYQDNKPTLCNTESAVMTYPNYQKCYDTPEMDPNSQNVAICFSQKATKTVFSSTRPWPLFGHYRFDKSFLDEFGTSLDSHILLVVTHKESNGIFTGRILKDDPPVLDIQSEESDVMVTSVESYFNVDLKKQCRIPELKGKFWVAVLLGKAVSPVLEFEVQ